MVIFLMVFGTPLLSGQLLYERWAGYPVQVNYAVTPDKFLGLIQVDRRSDWLLSHGINSYFYMPANWVGAEGAWAYAYPVDEVTYDFTYAGQGWLYARNSGTWVGVPDAVAAKSAGHGWVFVRNGQPLPDMFVVTEAHDAEPPIAWKGIPDFDNARPANQAELARFNNALRIGPEEMEGSIELDSDVTMDTGAEGITFTSTAASGNRYVRLFYHPALVGLLDLSGLKGLTGEIGVAVHATVDLSAATGGFYSRLINEGIAEEVAATPGIPDYVEEFLLGSNEVGPHSRLEKGTVYGDVLLEMYTLQPDAKPSFIELTLPPQASVTVREVFLHLEPEIRGFANIEERITGGEGASPENTYTVSGIYELLDALEAVQSANGPSIIYVDDVIDLADWVEAEGTQQVSISSSVRDMSLIGVGNNAIFDGIGIKIHGTNIIIENLTIRNAWMQDAFEINDARYVRVSHNTLYGDNGASGERFDEFMSIKNQARYVIISWNHTHSDPQGRGILIGSNDGFDSLPNRSVIIHHNWFQTTGSRHPLVRGGYSHIYNNFFDNVGWASNVRTRAKVRLENNYFLNVGRAIFLGEVPEYVDGSWELSGNIYDGGNSSYQPTESTVHLTFEDAYTYTLDPAEDVPAIVTAGAGAGK